MQEKYPGFGRDYLIFLDENNEEVYGYLARMKINFNIFNLIVDAEKSVTFKLYTR